MPKPIPSQPMGYYRPPMLIMGQPCSNVRMQRPAGIASLPMPLGHQIPRIGDNIFDPPSMWHDNMGPRWAHNQRNDRKKVRPSQLQKLCKAFDGSGDPTIMWQGLNKSYLPKT